MRFHFFLLFFYLIGLATSVDAQDKKWSVGIVGSPDLYFSKKTTTFDYKVKHAGFGLGAELAYGLTERSTFGIKAKWRHFRYQMDYNFVYLEEGDPAIPEYSTVKANFLEVPIFYELNVSFGEWEKIPRL